MTEQPKFTIIGSKKHLYYHRTLKGIASEYPKSNWYKIFYTTKRGQKIYSIFEPKTDVLLAV